MEDRQNGQGNPINNDDQEEEEEEKWHSFHELVEIGAEKVEVVKPLLLPSEKCQKGRQEGTMHAIMCSNQNRPHQHRNGRSPSTMPMTLDTTTTIETSLSIPTELVTVNGLGKHRLGPEAYCCCGAVQLRHAALGIAIVELLIFGYQLIATFFDLFLTPIAANDPTIPAHLFQPASSVPHLLTLLSHLLALIVCVLLAMGVLRRSPYLMLPHLLMQFTLLTATFLIALYVAVWILGGIEFRVNAVFFEQSPSGQQAVERALQRPPFVEANFTVSEMRVALVALLLLLLLGLLLQLAFFTIVLNTLRHFRSLGIEKSAVLKIRNGPILGKEGTNGEMGSRNSRKNRHNSGNGRHSMPPPAMMTPSPPTEQTTTSSSRASNPAGGGDALSQTSPGPIST